MTNPHDEKVAAHVSKLEARHYDHAVWVRVNDVLQAMSKALAACALESLKQGREQVLLMLSDELAKECRDELEQVDAVLEQAASQQVSGEPK